MTKRIAEFDLWRPGYGGSVVYIYVAGTTDLADVFTDEDLTEAAPNPQVLLAQTAPDGTRYGKFKHPLYTGDSYYINIQGIENTGVVRPSISSLSGEDASNATVITDGSSYPVSLSKIAALSVNVAMYGDFVEGSSGVAATNTATLELAIAALVNGGEVHIPAGTYKINAISVPQGVILVGDSRESTILQSIMGTTSFTIVGNRAGFKNITLDGNSLSSGSLGVKSAGNDEITFDSVIIRRFETGIHFLGGKGHIWQDFSIENVSIGAKLHGDTDSGDTGNGGPFSDLLWSGGLVSVATGVGVELSYEDTVCHNATLVGVGFEDCLGVGVVFNGCQNTQFQGCWWSGNTVNVDIHDDDLVLNSADDYLNDIINITLSGGRMNGGKFIVSGTLQNVVVQDMKFEGVEFELVQPIMNFLVLQDCFEDANVVITGETQKLLRSTSSLSGSSFGITTADAATKAWGLRLKPGQIVYLEAKVIGRGRNNTNRAIHHVACGAYRPGAELAYEAQSANFVVGDVIEGQTSGASARIQADDDQGTTGTLTLTDIHGTFLDDEIITGIGGGSATVNGAMTNPNVSLDTVGNTALRTAYETNGDWDAVFAANNQEVELRVTGDTSETVEWSVHVDVVSI